MIFAWVWFAYFLVFTHYSSYLGSCLDNQGFFALLSFKQSISSDPELSLSNWNSSDENPCSWNGITCKDQNVVSITIPKKKLVGFLHSSLGSLNSLRHINLRNNKLHGGLPIELFNLQGLQSLVLYGNFFTGSIPIQIGNLNYLQSLDLSQNLMNGALPKSLYQCRRLRTLVLSQNNFTGSLEFGFGSGLIALEKLDLSLNHLNGSIPSDMGNLSSLQGTVDLSHNHFSGLIPASLGNLPENVYIDLSFNDLSGRIPQNGALENRGPTAFIGNPRLCGPPLKNPCTLGANGVNDSSSIPFFPGKFPPLADDVVAGSSGKSGSNKGLSKNDVIAIVACDVVGICLIGLLFSYCYWRFCSCEKGKDESGKESRGKNECSCFRKDGSETLSENVEQCDLVALDMQVGFDLDELLKASAFVLGKSGIGIVYKVVLEDGLTVAVRRLGEGGSQRFKEFQTEVEAIGKIRHPNIVTLKAYYWSIDEKLLIYEYISNGDLSAAIHGKAGMLSFTPLTWCVRMQIIKGTAKGLVYLHEFSPKKYVHGDLKPNNILLGENMEPRISGFGLGRLANIAGGSPTLQSNRMSSEKQLQLQQSAPSEVPTISSATGLWSCYQAPEALKNVKPSQKWDVYSFGVVLLEMISGRSPMVQVGTTEMDLVRWIQLSIEEKKPLGDVLDPFLAREPEREEEIIAVLKIALACVQTSPERRPSMRHISHTFDRLIIAAD